MILCIWLSATWDRVTMKKVLRETQTLRAGCSKVEPKFFAPPQTPFPGTQDGQNLVSWRLSVPLPTDPVWWGSMHAISSYHGNRPTKPQTNRQDWLQYTASLASVQCNYIGLWGRQFVWIRFRTSCCCHLSCNLGLGKSLNFFISIWEL